MEQPSNTIIYQSSQLHYAVAGHGPTPLLLFHGFGQTHRAFEPWMEPLANRYKMFIFDLYFHGRSQWPEDRTLEKADWKAILTLLFEREKIDRFALGGYSLGGKFALATVSLFPDKITHLFLLAPDGVTTRATYTLATYPRISRKFFKGMILRPERFYAVARLFRSLGILNKRIVKFAESQMDTAEKRKRVYCSWVCFRHLGVRPARVATLLNQFGIPLTVLIGKYDQVIKVKAVQPLLRRVRQKEFAVLDSGHNDLIQHAVTFLVKNQLK